MDSNELREKFIKFFVDRGHKELPPASLIPENDTSVLFTTAGMQQFKRFYTNPEEAPAKNVVTIQPCLRTSDIEEVGDETHLTFFEMLGNFSFGGYFKKEAIEWGYEFLTKELGINPEKIMCSVFGGDGKNPRDDESAKILESMNLKYEEHGREDNFWGPTGNEGPCGPTVEFYVDGVEVWNLVFNEYYYKDDKFEPLKTPGVDTGMGLERMLVVKNNLKNVYETDVFLPIIEKIEEVSQKKYKEFSKEYKVIADHTKAAIFLLSSGVTPLGQDEEGSVLQRLIRHAVSSERFLGIDRPIGTDILEIVSNVYSGLPYLTSKEKIIDILESTEPGLFESRESLEKENREEAGLLKILESREPRFSEARESLEKEKQELRDLLAHHYVQIRSSIKEIKKSNARSVIRHVIWDPWFFLSTSLDLLEPELVNIENAERGKVTLIKNLSGLLAYRGPVFFKNFDPILKSELLELEKIAKAERFSLENKGFPSTVALSENMRLKIEEIVPKVADLVGKVLFDLKQEQGMDEYDFYVMFEDMGLSKRSPKVQDLIMRSFRESEKSHQEKSRTASAGMFKGGLVGETDITTRMHTATHLLLKALQEVLGKDVHQRGSNINEERIRFDFSYPKPMTEEEIKKVEDIVNEKIKEDLPVVKKETTVEEAKKLGAEAQFVEKYAQYGKLTMYSIDDYSHELCGGPHVKSTGEIGKFKITKEESSSSGVRRIRAALE